MTLLVRLTVIFITSILIYGCTSSSSNTEEQETSSTPIIPRIETWEKEDDNNLHFAIMPSISLVVLGVSNDTILGNDDKLKDYIERINKSLPKEYEGENGKAVVERISKIGNNLFVKIKVGNSIIEELKDPVQLGVMKLIYLDYLMHSVKYEHFKDAVLLITDNNLDIDYHIVAENDVKDIIIKHTELKDSIRSAISRNASVNH